GRRDRIVHIVDIDDRAVLLTQASHHRLAIGVKDRGRLRQRQLIRSRHPIHVIRTGHHHNPGQHDEDREPRNDQITNPVPTGEKPTPNPTPRTRAKRTTPTRTPRLIPLEVIITVIRTPTTRPTRPPRPRPPGPARPARPAPPSTPRPTRPQRPTRTARRPRTHRRPPNRGPPRCRRPTHDGATSNRGSAAGRPVEAAAIVMPAQV